MAHLIADERGRVTLPPSMRQRHGNEYVPILMPDGIHLFPVPKGPLKLGGKPESHEQRKRLNLRDMEKEVMDEYRTINEGKRGRKR